MEPVTPRVLSPVANRRLPSELKALRLKGYTIFVDEANDLGRWQVKLTFPPDTDLGSDLEIMKQHNVDCVLVEFEFPDQYPMKFPLVRIVSPRMQFLCAGITFGGTINDIDILSNKTWTPVMDVNLVLERLKTHLIENNARVDLEATQRHYTIQEARASLYRTKLITSSEIPTQGRFKQEYYCISASSVRRDGLATGNKVLLPESALGELSDTDIDLPYCFEIKTTKNLRTYCGVLEFIAPPNKIVLPDCMMGSLFLRENEPLDIRSVSLPRGTHVTFQPHSTKLLTSVGNDRNKMVALLEWVLPKYSTLTMGDTIEVQHGGQFHLLNIIETKPAQAVSLFAEPYLDIKIEFTSALDYVEEDLKTTDEKEELKGRSLANEVLRASQSSICKNCRRPVPKESAIMHENMCYRMNTLCPKCNCVVKKGELDSHIADQHALIECACGTKVEKIQMDQHKEITCGLRPVACLYCQYTCAANEIETHQIACGTRTQQCEHCKAFIQKKDTIDHLKVCKFNPNSEQNIVMQRFKCTLCELKLKDIVPDETVRESLLSVLSVAEFIQHVKSSHNNEPATKVICPICAAKHTAEGLFVTPKPVDLFHHMTIHEMRLLKEQHWRSQRKGEINS